MNVLKALLPSRLESIIYLFLDGLLLVFGNLTFLLNRYGLGQAQAYFGTSLLNLVHRATTFLDNFTLTPEVTAYIFWFIVGLAVLSLLRHSLFLLSGLRRDIDISSKFRHPTSFTQRGFWISLLLEFIVQVCSVLILLTTLYLLATVILPYGLGNIRHFVITPSNLYGLLLVLFGYLVIWVALVSCSLSAKLFISRQKLVQLGKL